MRLLVLFALLVVAAGCRSTDPYVVPDVPPDVAALVLSDAELPRTVYASVWGAFAVAGWEVVEHNAETFELRVQAPEAGMPVRVIVETDVEYGRVVMSKAVATAEEPGALEEAAAVLATVPGDLAVR